VPAAAGAVYKPLAEIVPDVAAHVTAVLPLPLTVAVNCCVPPTNNEDEVGLIAIETAAEETVIVALADLLGSATLVAVTVYVPAVAGAV
jgi:hypothetical protein